jgi:hypothetical protein
VLTLEFYRYPTGLTRVKFRANTKQMQMQASLGEMRLLHPKDATECRGEGSECNGAH